MSEEFIIDTTQNMIRGGDAVSQDPFHHLPATEWVQNKLIGEINQTHLASV